MLYSSLASNLVPGDTNHAADIFLYDRTSKKTERVSVADGGGQANGPSEFFAYLTADARYVVFRSAASNLVPHDTNGRADVFMLDRQTRKVERLSVSSAGAQANGDSVYPTVSADGRYIAFHSDATNLVAGDTNGKNDVFVRDRTARTTTRVSLGAARGAAQQHQPLRQDHPRRPLRRLQIAGHQPRRRRQQRQHRRLRPRPAGRHDKARQP